MAATREPFCTILPTSYCYLPNVRGGDSANFRFTEFSEVRECGVSRKLASKVSKTTHFGGCTAPRDAVTLGVTTPVRKGGELDEGDRPRRVRLSRCPGTQGHRQARDRRRRGTGSRACGRCGSGCLARNEGSALPDTPRGLRSPRAQEPRHRLGRGRGGGDSRQECEQVRAWRRGVRYRQGLLRRVRTRTRGQARAHAREPRLRAGGGSSHHGLDCPASL